jgi:uncharacterized coiled-coil protein SlyX
MTYSIRFLGAAALISLAACKDKVALARADSLSSMVTEQQALTSQLASQKDSLTRVVLDADAFLGQMDSAIKTVKGMPRHKRKASDPLADQLQARKDMQERVSALVARAKQTASQLAELEKKQTDLQTRSSEQATKIEQDAQLIGELGATIERQNAQIAVLEARLDSLGTEMRTLGERHYKAYYVIGSEDELKDKGVVVKEGGANLLFVHPGKTLVPARVLNPDAFTAIDQREAMEIQVPDTTRRYRLISRQSLDAADVQGRDGTTFKGNLKISKPNDFWASSRFLILVKL